MSDPISPTDPPVTVTLVLSAADYAVFLRELELQRTYAFPPEAQGGSDELGSLVVRALWYLADYRAKDEATHPREEGERGGACP